MPSMRQTTAAALIGLTMVSIPAMGYADTDIRVGAGANYWWSANDTKIDKIDEKGLGWLASVQIRPRSLLSIQVDLEYFQDGFMGLAGTAYAPQAFILLGSTIYAGAGVGIFYENGDFDADPFYILRAGLDLKLFPRLHLDINGNYRFATWSSDLTKDIDADTITLGAALRIEL